MFHFKQFSIADEACAMRVGTDGVVLGAWAEAGAAGRALDIGSGSGLIGLMLAQRFPDLQIDAVDIHAPSARQAAENFARSPWPQRLSAHAAAVQDFAAQQPAGHYGCIVSNPPFFTAGHAAPEAGRAAARHADTLPPEALFAAVRHLLPPDGQFSIIWPQPGATALRVLAMSQGLYVQRSLLLRGRAQKPVVRQLLAFGKKAPSQRPPESELCVYGEGRAWSEGFRALTRDFYLHA